MERRRTVRWSDLPEDLLAIISSFVNPNHNLLDILRFRSVCRQWRSSLPLIIPQPLLSPNLPLKISLYFSSSTFLLSACTVYLLHPPLKDSSRSPPPLPWLLFVDEWNPGKLRVRYPFSLNLAAKHALDCYYALPSVLSLHDFRVLEIATYGVYTCGNYGQDGFFTSNPYWTESGEYINKVVLLSDGTGAMILTRGMLCFKRFGEIGLRKQSFGKGCLLDDIVEHNGVIYAVNRRGKLFRIDNDSLEGIVVADGMRNGSGRRKRLVESFEVMYLIVRCPAPENDPTDLILKVYKLEERDGNGKWAEVTSLGDKIFFVGPDFSFSVSAADLQATGLQGNRIFLGKDSFCSYRYNGSDLEPFLTASPSKLCIGVFHLEEHGGRFGLITPDTDYSGIFWPPPHWLDVSK